MPASIPKGWESSQRLRQRLTVEIILMCLVTFPLAISIIFVWDNRTIQDDWWILAMAFGIGSVLVVGFSYVLWRTAIPPMAFFQYPIRSRDALTAVRDYLDENGLKHDNDSPEDARGGAFNILDGRVRIEVWGYGEKTTEIKVRPYPNENEPRLDELLVGLQNALHRAEE